MLHRQAMMLKKIYGVVWFFALINSSNTFFYKNIFNLKNGDQMKSQQKPFKTVAWYNHPTWMKQERYTGGEFGRCEVNSCRMDYTSQTSVELSDAIVFDVEKLPNIAPPARVFSNQIWIFFALEPAIYFKSFVYQSPKWKGVFNWTMTYRLDSDIPSPYATIALNPKPTPDFAAILKNKSRLIGWVVSRCQSQSLRNEFAQQLQQYFPVDIFGRCGPFKCKGKDCFKQIESKYKFYLSFENSFCTDYITEKFFRMQNLNVVVIVRGGGDYSRHYPPGTYIDTRDFSSIRELAAYIQYLDVNDNAYLEILRKKSGYISSGASRNAAFCELCRKLHEEDNGNIIPDITSWWNNQTCYAPRDLEAYTSEL